jgi:hypothetical protein
MQVTRKRVSTFAPSQAIIFLELQRRIGIAESDSNTIAHRQRSPHAEGALEELICETCSPLMSENFRSIFEHIFCRSSTDYWAVWPPSPSKERPASCSPYFGKKPSQQMASDRFTFFSLATILTASIVAGPILTVISRDAAGSGVPQAKVAFWRDFGFMPARVVVAKFFAGAISIAQLE